MADEYIDSLECIEYGEHFINEIPKLSGASKLVDIPELRAYVSSAMNAVAAELAKQGINRSDARFDRKDVDAKTGLLRKEIEKFHHYLGSLDDDLHLDVAAFFPGKILGSPSLLKPADLAQKAGEISRGFSANANQNLPDATKWKKRIDDAQSALVSALAGKGSSTGSSIQGTAALAAARQSFLVAYTGVAKKLVSGVLISLGRKDELRLFFKDLQVNESRSPKTAEEKPAEGG